jgi:signal transduction histidine kinase
MVEEQKRFVSDASHELRTPLTSLRTEIEVALRDKKMDLSDAKKLLGSNLEEVDKMQKLSNYLLALNKYQGGENQKSDKINLKTAVGKAIERVKILASKKDIKIENHLEDVNVRAGELALTELTVILLDNAIKYSHNGGKVKVSVKRVGKFATLEVKDNGVGIKSSDLPYIFNRFYRADSSRNKDKTDGYGLGLSIAKAITESFGGEIKVISKPSLGSAFLVKFPKV